MNAPETNLDERNGGQPPSQTPEHSTGGSETARQAAEDLCHVADKIEKFMTQQLDRIEIAIRRTRDQTQNELGSEDQLSDFEQRQRKWERERDAEVKRLRDEGQLLAEAWEQLEAEQRRVLAERGAMQGTSGTANSPAHQATGVHQKVPAAPSTVNPQPDSRKSAQQTLPAAPSREEAVRQFQHLKREIGKHHRKNR